MKCFLKVLYMKISIVRGNCLLIMGNQVLV